MASDLRPADPNGTAETPVPPARRVSGEADLVHVHPPRAGTGDRYPLGPKPVLVGRDEECGLVDPDPSVSRRHAIILLQSDGRFLLTDLGSRNGTAVNDGPVAEAVLADGDHVRFGSSVYRFLVPANR